MNGLGILLFLAVTAGEPSLLAVVTEVQESRALAPANGADSSPAAEPEALPVDLNRIKRVLAQPPAIRPESTQVVYRIEIFGRKPTINDILGPDFLKGPTMAGPMTHQEFLDMVTPKDVQGYAAFTNKEGMMVAATSFALQWALRQAVSKFQDAITERQKEAARKEVEEALAALRKARREAGLPDK